MALLKTISALAAVLAVSTSAATATQTIGKFAMRDSVTEETNPKNTAPVYPAPGAKVFVVQQLLSEFLRLAARRNGYEITLSKRVRGTIRKAELPHDINGILEKLSSQFDLKWHFQGKQLFVSVGSETTSRLIFLGSMNYSELKNAMRDAEMGSKTFDLSYVEDSNSVLVNGPVSYIASIELLADSYNKRKKSSKNGVKVIRFGTVGK